MGHFARRKGSSSSTTPERRQTLSERGYARAQFMSFAVSRRYGLRVSQPGVGPDRSSEVVEHSPLSACHVLVAFLHFADAAFLSPDP